MDEAAAKLDDEFKVEPVDFDISAPNTVTYVESIKVRCRCCGTLNDVNAKNCKACGATL